MAPRKQSKQQFSDIMLGNGPDDTQDLHRRTRKRVTFAEEQALHGEAERLKKHTKPASKASAKKTAARKTAAAKVNATKAALARARANKEAIEDTDSTEDPTADTSTAASNYLEETSRLREELKKLMHAQVVEAYNAAMLREWIAMRQ